MPLLRPEQSAAVSSLCHTSTLLVADVGAGKTATALRTLAMRSLIYGKSRTLIFGTVRICNAVWGAEVAKWTPGVTYASVAGKPPAERKRIMEDPSIDLVGLNFDNIIWAVKTYGEDLPRMFPQLVIDESSWLENPSAKSFSTLRPLLPHFRWRLPMTATPQANHMADLWGNVYLADLGQALGTSKDAYLQNFFHPVRKLDRLGWIPQFQAPERIHRRIEDKGSVYRLPFRWREPIEIDVPIPCHPKVHMIQKIIDERIGDSEPVAIEGVTYTQNGQRMHAKMLQLSSGLVYRDDQSILELHTEKLAALEEIVKEARGEPIMVVYQFIHERDAILAYFPQARLLDEASLVDWNRGNVEILLVHPRSCGHGLNAQFGGCDLQVWYTPTPDAELYRQTVGRLNRPGNDKSVRVMRLVMQGTKDRAAYLVIAARMKGENSTLDMFE